MKEAKNFFKRGHKLRMEKDVPSKYNQKVDVYILITDKINFEAIIRGTYKIQINLKEEDD